MVGQHVDDIGYRNLQNNVHTTFQVQTKTNLHLLALLVRINAEIHFLVLDRIEILLSCFFAHSSCLVLEVLGYETEGQVEAANQQKQYCNCLYNSFVLHCFLLLFYRFYAN